MKLLTAYFSHSGMNYTPGGMGRSEADIRRLCPEAEVEDGLSVRGSKVKDSAPEIEAWLKFHGVI